MSYELIPSKDRTLEMHILRYRYPHHEATNHEAPGELAIRHEEYTSATNESCPTKEASPKNENEDCRCIASKQV